MTNTTKTIIGITSALFVGVAGYFIWRGIKKGKDAKALGNKLDDLKGSESTLQVTTTDGTQTTTTTTDTRTTPTNTTTTTQTQGSPTIYTPPTLTYPIMFGQKGDNVKKLQQMLLQYDNKILPKYGADGSFGTETANALNKILGNSIVRNEADRNKIASEINKRLLAFRTAANLSVMPLGIQLFR
jgi:hypothetical protein